MTSIGKLPLSKVLPYLKDIAQEMNLRLNRPAEFKMARMILVQRYRETGENFLKASE